MCVLVTPGLGFLALNSLCYSCHFRGILGRICLFVQQRPGILHMNDYLPIFLIIHCLILRYNLLSYGYTIDVLTPMP
jgi:hypothetical protein